MGHRSAGAILDLPWNLAVLDTPRPPGMDTPFPLPPESSIWTLQFVLQCMRHKLLGQGRWVWIDEWGVHPDKPLCLGGFQGGWQWQLDLEGAGGGDEVRQSNAGVKMFEIVVAGVVGEHVERVAGFDPAAANWGAYAGVVQGIASRPKNMPQPEPVVSRPLWPHPQTPGCLQQGPRCDTPHRGHAKHGMLLAQSVPVLI